MMKYCFFLILTALIINSCAPDGSSEKSGADLPNIVYIMADDMGYGDVGAYNDKSKIPTPAIDRLAEEGLMFTDAHSPDALCSPSRYGLLTGRYCWRTRLKQGVLIGYDETALIDKDTKTIANVLDFAGYTTAFVGKWHMGWTWETRDGYIMQDDMNRWQDDPVVFRTNEQNVDFTKPIKGGPVELGFDYFFGTYGCSTSDPPYGYIENRMMVEIPSVMSRDEYDGLPGFLPGLMAPDWVIEEVDTVLTKKAISFIENATTEKPDSPFFLLLALSAPHNPFIPPGFAIGESDEGPRGDLVTVVDLCTEMVLETLKELGIEDNTMVIFTSDNGPMRGANGHRSAGDLRGFKSNIWEGGHRVPFIVKWPGKTSPGTISNELISQTDMYATLSSLVESPLKEMGGEDSYNVLPALTGKQVEGNSEKARVFHSGNNVYALRTGDWKLIEGTKGSGSGRINITGDSLQNNGQLYNMKDDPFESNDLWNTYPDKVKELQEILNSIKNKE